MIKVQLGKGQGLANIARIGLSQGIVPTFHVIGFAGALANAAVRFFRKNQGISVPEITETVTLFVRIGNALPQLATRVLTPISNDEGNDLASPATHRRPEPAFVRTPINKGPNFIQFQGVRGLRRRKRLGDGGRASGFFLTSSTRLGA